MTRKRLSLSQDSLVLAKAMNLSTEGAYFNCGVMLMNLDELRRQHFLESAVDFLNRWSGKYRFWDQSVINFLLHGQIDDLPEHWNRASWRFDAQQNNDLDCVLHYTTSAPWLGGIPRPAQVLFERFAAEAGLPVNRRLSRFQGLGEMQWPHCERLLFQLRRCAIGWLERTTNRRLIRKWRVTGLIIFATRRAVAGSIAGATKKLAG